MPTHCDGCGFDDPYHEPGHHPELHMRFLHKKLKESERIWKLFTKGIKIIPSQKNDIH
jgi:hypothetical protein